ncbi:hypothetical protein, partial [Yinghuangia soli]
RGTTPMIRADPGSGGVEADTMKTSDSYLADIRGTERASALARAARRVFDDGEVHDLVDQLMRRMESVDPDSKAYARFATCVVELVTAPPRGAGTGSGTAS